MGSGISANKIKRFTDDDALASDFYDAVEDLDDDERNRVCSKAMQDVIETLAEDGDDDPGFVLLTIDRNEGGVKIKEFEKKKKCKKQLKKAGKKGHAAVMIKDGEVFEKQIFGEPQKVAFLIGAGYGKGWCNLGPLADEDSEYQIFTDDGDSDDETGGDSDDDSDDDEDDDNFHLIGVSNDGSGIKDMEVEDKKKAKKKWKNWVRKGKEGIFVRKGNIKKFIDPEDDQDKIMRLSFIIGTAWGKDMIENLGPLEDDGPLAILEDDFDVDEDLED